MSQQRRTSQKTLQKLNETATIKVKSYCHTIFFSFLAQCGGRVSDRGGDPKKRWSKNRLFEKKTNLLIVELMVMQVT